MNPILKRNIGPEPATLGVTVPCPTKPFSLRFRGDRIGYRWIRQYRIPRIEWALSGSNRDGQNISDIAHPPDGGGRLGNVL